MTRKQRLVLPLLFLLLFSNGVVASDEEKGQEAQPDRCGDTVAEPVTPKKVKETPPDWGKLLDQLQSRTAGLPHPFFAAGFDPDAIGRLQLRFRELLPGYGDLFPAQMPEPFTHDRYRELKGKVWPAIQGVIGDRAKPPMAVFAAVEALRRLTVLEALAPSPVDEDRASGEKKEGEQEGEVDKKEEKDKGEKEQGEEIRGDQGGEGAGGQSDSADGEPQQGGSAPSANDSPWSQPPDRYIPDNKRLEQQPAEKQPVILRTDVVVPGKFLPDSFYDIVTPTHMAANRFIRPQPTIKKALAKAGVMRVSPLGARRIKLSIPYDVTYTPQTRAGFEAAPIGMGEWEARLSEPRDEIEIDLYSTEKVTWNLAVTDEAVYSAPSGIPHALWPEKMRLFMQDLKKKGLPREDAAEELRKFLKREDVLRYYSKQKKVPEEELDKADRVVKRLMAEGYPKPVALAHGGLVNCDGVAWIYALLGKDFLQLPLRAVGGWTVSSQWRAEGKTWALVRKGTPRHMWNELWTGKGWRPYDPTPDSDLGGGGEGEGDDSGDSGQGQGEGGQSRSQSGGQSGDRSQANGGDSSGDSQEGRGSGQGGDGVSSGGPADRRALTAEKKENGGGQQATVPREGGGVSSQDQMGTGEGGSGSQDGAPGDPSATQAEGRELSPKLHILNEAPDQATPPERSLLLRALAETIELHALERGLQQGSEKGGFDQAVALLKQWSAGDADRLAAVTPSVQRLAAVAEHLDAGPLSNRLAEIRLAVAQGEFRNAWWELRSIAKLIDAIAARRPLTTTEQTFLDRLNDVIVLFDSIKHADAGKYDMALWVMQSLPGSLSRRWVKENYGDVLQLGSASLDRFSTDIEELRLGPLVRMAFLGKFGRMVSNYVPEPTWEERVLLERNTVPLRRQDEIVLARSPLELPRMLLNPRPGESLWAPLFERRQFALGSRRRVIEQSRSRTLDRKLSVVFFDVSGSMGGNPLKVQNDLLGVFVDKALSEVDRMGNPLHEVYLFPFNGAVLEGRKIKTVAEGMAFVTDRIADRLPFSADGGTDIQAALLAFYDSVGQSYRNPDPINVNRKLRHATMVLFTDGGSSVDLQTVLDARKQVPDDVKLYINFVGIGGSNDTVEELARTSGISTTLPLVRVLEADEMNRLANISGLSKGTDRFATELGAFQSPPEIVRGLNRLGERPLSSVDFVSTAADTEIARLLAALRPGGPGAVPAETQAMRGDLTALVKAARKFGAVDPVLKRKLMLALAVSYPAAVRRGPALLYAEEIAVIREVDQWSRE